MIDINNCRIEMIKLDHKKLKHNEAEQMISLETRIKFSVSKLSC